VPLWLWRAVGSSVTVTVMLTVMKVGLPLFGFGVAVVFANVKLGVRMILVSLELDVEALVVVATLNEDVDWVMEVDWTISGELVVVNVAVIVVAAATKDVAIAVAPPCRGWF
jgi:hypothetical protein